MRVRRDHDPVRLPLLILIAAPFSPRLSRHHQAARQPLHSGSAERAYARCKLSPIFFVVDDDPHLRDALGLLLGTAGFVVCSFESAEAMINALRPEQPICALVDLIMPGMGGLGLVRELARRQKASSVIVVTGHGDVPMAVEAMKAGAMHFIEKPFEPETLLDLVGETMQRTRQLAHELQQIQALRQSIAALTTRECEVLELLAEGSPNKVIAGTLDISGVNLRGGTASP